jgi:hypothetical protein
LDAGIVVATQPGGGREIEFEFSVACRTIRLFVDIRQVNKSRWFAV